MEKFDMLWYPRPAKREDCLNNIRPCPWISCKFHMIWMLSKPELKDLSDDGFVDKIMNLKETCVIDVADRQGSTLEEIGQILGISRERVRQIGGESDKDYIKTGISKLRKSPRRMRELKRLMEQEY